jgi:hypothetical protein
MKLPKTTKRQPSHETTNQVGYSRRVHYGRDSRRIYRFSILRGSIMQKLTDQNVIDWLGSDFTRADFIDMLRDIANGVYRVEQLNQDITDYIEE